MLHSGALIALAVPWYQSYRDQANINKTITDMRTIDTQIQLYKQANNSYPSALTEVAQGNTVDPWGNAFQTVQSSQDVIIRANNDGCFGLASNY